MTELVIICPDTNVELSVDAPARRAIRGGKSAIVQLAAAWARAGHDVTLFAGRAVPGQCGRFSVHLLHEAAGRYDVAIYVTGALGHFRDPLIGRIAARVNIFWVNGPHRVEPPQHANVDWTVVPAKFLARRAIDEWGLPADRVVFIPGEAVRARLEASHTVARDPLRGIFASHPVKGLREALDVLTRCRADGAPVRLDAYGSSAFWGQTAESADSMPSWFSLQGDLAEADLARRMLGYGFMPYFTDWLDGFSTATAEAMAAGVIVFATSHGSNADFVRHGWNGFLVRAVDGRPDLEQARSLLAAYLRAPERFEAVRADAMRCVPTWDEQAAAWAQVWSR